MSEKKDFFKNLAKQRYIANVTQLIDLTHKRTRDYITLAFTFAALSFFGIFAINPTLTTILNLRKQLEDSKFVNMKLEEKIANLTTLQQQYNALAPDLPTIFAALPQKSSSPYLLSQFQAIAQSTKVTVDSLQVKPFDLSQKSTGSFDYSLEVIGTYENLTRFLSSLAKFDRIIAITSLTFNREIVATDDQSAPASDERSLIIEGASYFRN
jgi:Tfp pilus assembly protein PilO